MWMQLVELWHNRKPVMVCGNHDNRQILIYERRASTNDDKKGVSIENFLVKQSNNNPPNESNLVKNLQLDLPQVTMEKTRKNEPTLSILEPILIQNV